MNAWCWANCPTCEGKGSIEYLITAVHANIEPETRMDDCPTCERAGVIKIPNGYALVKQTPDATLAANPS